MSRLQNLYTQLMEEPWLRSWHEDYQAFYDEVEETRDRINKRESLSPDTDEAFLRKLLYDIKNGVASAGLSILKEEHFKSFIADEKFRLSLQKLIREPNEQNWIEFENVWYKIKNGHNYLRVNRVAAACTFNVSTTVDETRFNQVFNWLMDEKIITPTEEELKKMPDWFSKNQFLMGFMRKEFSEELDKKEIDRFDLSIFVWQLCENVSNRPFSIKKQIVKYGPPGTGKTYKAKKETKLWFDIWKDKFAPNNSKYTYGTQHKLVQFHPSFSYEDFIEGLRPVPDQDGKVKLKLQNGVFKEFCIEAGQWEIDIYNLDKKLEWESLTIEELKKYNNENPDELKGDHWNYIWDGEAPQESKVMDVVPPFFFIIDEINRAELSRVFGELMYCLEYRGVGGMIKTQYANLNTDKTETGMLKIDKDDYHFFIPTNVYLVGTMNTIDRSVESFDLALRRRFRWQKVMPDTDLLGNHLRQEKTEWADLANDLWKLNEAIAGEHLLGPDYQIGHAYLMNMNYEKYLKIEDVKKDIWEDSILPLLEEYLRGSGTYKETELISSLKEAFFKKKKS